MCIVLILWSPGKFSYFLFVAFPLAFPWQWKSFGPEWISFIVWPAETWIVRLYFRLLFSLFTSTIFILGVLNTDYRFSICLLHYDYIFMCCESSWASGLQLQTVIYNRIILCAQFGLLLLLCFTVERRLAERLANGFSGDFPFSKFGRGPGTEINISGSPGSLPSVKLKFNLLL